MKKRIVIVDDFVNTRWITGFTLKSLDHELISVENGNEALRLFDGRQVDLLITDFNMPEMNGGELVRRVRKNPVYSNLPVLVLSTEKNKDIINSVEALNIKGWVQKPFKRDEFVNLVKECLNV